MAGGVLENDPCNPPLTAEDQAQAQRYFEGPGIVNTYHVEQGICILPIAEDPPDCTDTEALANWSPVAVMRLHSPFRHRIAKFSVKKTSTPPVLPSPIDTGAFVFIGGNLMFTNVITSSNTYDWICETEYNYIENCVSRTQDGFILGVPGFLYPSQVDNVVSIPEGVVPNSPGAIGQGGNDAARGWVQGTDLKSIYYPYDTMSYFPGTLFNDDLMNGQLPPAPTPTFGGEYALVPNYLPSASESPNLSSYVPDPDEFDDFYGGNEEFFA